MARSGFLVVLLLAVAAAGPAAAGTFGAAGEGSCPAVTHVARPDVAYAPGVDAAGRPVAPADLDDEGRLDLSGEEVVVDISVPLRRFPGVVGDPEAFTDAGGAVGDFDSTATAGKVTVRDATVSFNDQPLAPPGGGEAMVCPSS